MEPPNLGKVGQLRFELKIAAAPSRCPLTRSGVPLAHHEASGPKVDFRHTTLGGQAGSGRKNGSAGLGLRVA